MGNFCDAPIIVDTRTKEVRYGPSFHDIAHFSRFVRPGARRLGSEGPSELTSIAFANSDGSVVAIVLNSSPAPVAFALAAGGDTLACTIPGRAIQTCVRR